MRSPTSRRCCPYTPAYRRAEVLDRYDDGRPHHVRLAVRVLGRLDEEILEFRWGPDWLVWDAERTKQQYAQHVEYTLRPDHTGTSTVVTGRHHRRARFADPGLLHQASRQDDDRRGNRGAAQSGAEGQGFRSTRVDRNSRLQRGGWSRYADRNRAVSQPASRQRRRRRRLAGAAALTNSASARSGWLSNSTMTRSRWRGWSARRCPGLGWAPRWYRSIRVIR